MAKLKHSARYEEKGTTKYYSPAVSDKRKAQNEARKKLEDLRLAKDLEMEGGTYVHNSNN